mgnify:CR=1 FL=1
MERQPTQDEQDGMDWWNGLNERMRKYWMAQAETGVVADAWEIYKNARADYAPDDEAS